MKEVYITKLGAETFNNGWVENQFISCHENLAGKFIEKGYAVAELGEASEKVIKKAKKDK